MTALRLILAAATALCTCVPVFAGEQPNLLIVSEDADQDTIPRNSRIFNRVERAIASEMQAKGFRVYDETAVSMDITDPHRTRRNDAELISVARRVSAPIDAITVFQIYASTEKNQYADIVDLRVRIDGRILEVANGTFLGAYEVSYGPGDLPPLPVNCDRDCVLEHVGDQARRVAADVGAELAARLDAISPVATAGSVNAGAAGAVPEAVQTVTVAAPAAECDGLTQAYTLQFRGFEPSELTRIEEYLVSFKGYDHHRPLRTDTVQSDYWYETCSDAARLNRNLRLMTEIMDTDARVAVTAQRIEIEKRRVPVER
jgi:hypothetical protein